MLKDVLLIIICFKTENLLVVGYSVHFRPEGECLSQLTNSKKEYIDAYDCSTSSEKPLKPINMNSPTICKNSASNYYET